jgi:hypothetical protein
VLNGDTLSALLYVLATGNPNRAKTIVDASDELGDAERERLRPIVEDPGDPAEQVRRLADALRELGADETMLDQCDRLSFYLSKHPGIPAEIPLLAYMFAHADVREQRKLEDELFWAKFEQRKLEDELARAESELRVIENDLLESWAQIKAMRRTVSWRITAPLRVVRRLLRKQ